MSEEIVHVPPAWKDALEGVTNVVRNNIANEDEWADVAKALIVHWPTIKNFKANISLAQHFIVKGFTKQEIEIYAVTNNFGVFEKPIPPEITHLRRLRRVSYLLFLVVVRELINYTMLL